MKTTTTTTQFRPIKRTFHNVEIDLRPTIEKNLQTASKRFRKFGAAPLTAEFGPVKHHTVRDHIYGCDQVISRYEYVTVTGNAPFMAGGWMPFASLDHTYGERPIVSLFPVAYDNENVLPERFSTASPACDHCKSTRKRNVTVVFTNDAGEFLQVGRSCLRDFTGLTPDAIWWMCSDTTIWDIPEGNGGGEPRFAIETVLAYAAFQTERFGFQPSSADSEEGGCSTKSQVIEMLHYTKSRQHPLYSIMEEYRSNRDHWVAEAQAITAWVNSDAMDWEPGITAVTAAAAGKRTFGVLAALPMMYNRHISDQVEKAAAAAAQAESNFVGTVGAKVTVTGTVTRTIAVETNYGTSLRFVVTTDNGDTVTTFGSGNSLWECKVGDKVEFSGTIKDHTDDNWGKQTHLTRAKAKVLQGATSAA